MTIELLHPTEAGFEQAMTIDIGHEWISSALDRGPFYNNSDVVYLFTNHAGQVFRVGQTGRPLYQRVADYQSVMRLHRGSFKRGEVADGHRMRLHTGGKPFTVWAKHPARCRHAEELKWFEYYKPPFGTRPPGCKPSCECGR